MEKPKWYKDKVFIWGKELLINELMYENKNEFDTLNFIDKNLDSNLKEQFDEIGSALSLLSQIASCSWACSEENHLKENLVRRLTNYFFAAIRLTNLGLYNESFSLIRSVGELANLLKLFCIKHEEFENWSSLDSKELWEEYKPEKVRLKLKNFGIPEIMDRETYSELCGIGIHPSIEFAMVSHQETGKVYIGCEFSEYTITIIYNELTVILSQILGCIGDLVKINEKHKEVLIAASQSLAELKNSKLNLPLYINQIEKDGFAKLSLDVSRVNEFILALSKHNIYFIVIDKPKRLKEIVNEKGIAPVDIYAIESNSEDIVPVFSTERKVRAYIASLSAEDQKICRGLKVGMRPILEYKSELTIILNYETEFQRELTKAEIEELRKLMTK